jgi:hypothetical protein
VEFSSAKIFFQNYELIIVSTAGSDTQNNPDRVKYLFLSSLGIFLALSLAGLLRYDQIQGDSNVVLGALEKRGIKSVGG